MKHQRFSGEVNAGDPPLPLGVLRREFGVSQANLGRQMGRSQAGVLKIERSADPQVSTVRSYVQALGMALDVAANVALVATINGREFRLDVATRRGERSTESGDGGSVTSKATKRAWRLRVWDDPEIERYLLNHDLIAISSDELGDLMDEPTDGELRTRLSAAFPQRLHAVGTFARYWRIFLTDMAVGDIVVVPMTGRRAAIAEVIGDHAYQAEQSEPRLRHVRAVRWLATNIDRNDLDADIRKVVNAPGTVCAVGAPAAAERLIETSNL